MIKYILPILLLIFSYSCKKENIQSNENASLHFSNDTIIFDTIFTSIGSITHQLTVYNNNNFDVITMFHVLAHLPRQIEFLRKIYKPGQYSLLL